MGKLVLVSALLAGLGGCYKVNYQTGLPGGGAKHTTKVSHFLFGAAGGGNIDVNGMCPNGVATVHEEHSFVDQILAGITLFIYSPTSVEVECAGNKSAAR